MNTDFCARNCARHLMDVSQICPYNLSNYSNMLGLHSAL